MNGLERAERRCAKAENHPTSLQNSSPAQSQPVIEPGGSRIPPLPRSSIGNMALLHATGVGHQNAHGAASAARRNPIHAVGREGMPDVLVGSSAVACLASDVLGLPAFP